MKPSHFSNGSHLIPIYYFSLFFALLARYQNDDDDDGGGWIQAKGKKNRSAKSGQSTTTITTTRRSRQRKGFVGLLNQYVVNFYLLLDQPFLSTYIYYYIAPIDV